MKYYLRDFADRHFPDIGDRKLRNKTAEQRLVQLFFGESKEGYFVEVGANDPKCSSQTWHLEQKGWQGILVEPIPELCEDLRKNRPRSIVVQAACGAPEQKGPAKFYVAEGLSRSTLEQNTVSLNVSFSRTEIVDLRTLSDILEEVHPPNVDFISIDVEGLQLNVLRGLNMQKHRPGLLLVEDHLHNLQTHRYLTARNYHLVKRTARNNWYVPREASFVLNTPLERLLLWQKVWLRTPFRKLRIAWKASRRNTGQTRG
ncbi:MAG: FkbM family methyltransferase [Acidiferrobacterales bacterium]